MEPLELGPNAGSESRASPVPDMAVQQENDDVYEVGDPPRFAAQGHSVDSGGRAQTHGSTEVWAFFSSRLCDAAPKSAAKFVLHHVQNADA